MYRGNLSFRQLKVYLKILVDKGFLRLVSVNECNQKVQLYQVTKDGLSFLEAYNALRGRLGEKSLTP
jgi:predicted transcriptional regulator